MKTALEIVVLRHISSLGAVIWKIDFYDPNPLKIEDHEISPRDWTCLLWSLKREGLLETLKHKPFGIEQKSVTMYRLSEEGKKVLYEYRPKSPK